jgi:hypothetical protein
VSQPRPGGQDRRKNMICVGKYPIMVN